MFLLPSAPSQEAYHNWSVALAFWESTSMSIFGHLEALSEAPFFLLKTLSSLLLLEATTQLEFCLLWSVIRFHTSCICIRRICYLAFFCIWQFVFWNQVCSLVESLSWSFLLYVLWFERNFSWFLLSAQNTIDLSVVHNVESKWCIIISFQDP